MVYKEGFGKLFYASGQILIVINSQRSTNKLVIWSHCLWPFVSTFKRESLAGQFLLKNPTILWDNELKAQELYLWEQVLCSDDDYYNLSIAIIFCIFLKVFSPTRGCSQATTVSSSIFSAQVSHHWTQSHPNKVGQCFSEQNWAESFFIEAQLMT